ncbi:MAG: RNA polymerase sigma factor [Bacteroidetes bacterium]|nr:RNA polymerase sigma factor [Bacteroidota bacterium]
MKEIVEEKDLLEGCKQGNRKCQKLLFEGWFGEMYAVAKRYSRDDDEAKDVVQNGFIKVFTRINSYTGEGTFKAWVHRVMVRTAIDQYRHNKRIAQVFERGIEYDVPVEAEVEGHIAYEEITLIIDMLSPLQKNIFYMAVMDGFSHKEIGEELGITEGTSKWHLYEGRKKLKILLETYYGVRRQEYA